MTLSGVFSELRAYTSPSAGKLDGPDKQGITVLEWKPDPVSAISLDIILWQHRALGASWMKE